MKDSDLPTLKRRKGKVLASEQSGRRPHLAFVLAEYPDEVVVWTLNLQDFRSAGPGQGFGNGSYFTQGDTESRRREGQVEFESRRRNG